MKLLAIDTKTSVSNVKSIIRFFKGVLGTRFGSLELNIGSLESVNIVIGSLQVHTRYLTVSLKKLAIMYFSL